MDYGDVGEDRRVDLPKGGASRQSTCVENVLADGITGWKENEIQTRLTTKTPYRPLAGPVARTGGEGDVFGDFSRCYALG